MRYTKMKRADCRFIRQKIGGILVNREKIIESTLAVSTISWLPAVYVSAMFIVRSILTELILKRSKK